MIHRMEFALPSNLVGKLEARAYRLVGAVN